MSLRGRVNGLASRPHHIKRLVGEELHKRQLAGGRKSGHKRAEQAEARAVQAVLELIQDRRTTEPTKRTPLRVILRAFYRHTYQTGFKAARLKSMRAIWRAADPLHGPSSQESTS